ncbi:MAG: S8 family serine peptidase [Cyanobacteria bacterium P01_H01_bin.105]
MEPYISDSFNSLFGGLDVLDSTTANPFTRSNYSLDRSSHYGSNGASLDSREELLASLTSTTAEYAPLLPPSTLEDIDSLLSNLSDISSPKTAKLPTIPAPKKDPLLGSSFSQPLLSTSPELSRVDNTSLPTSQLNFSQFSLFDASGDSTANTVFDDGALRLNYSWSGQIASLKDVRLELVQNNATATLGTWTGRSVTNALVNLADVSDLTTGTYDFRLVARNTNGTNVFSDVQSINILPWLTTSGSFKADTLTYDGSAKASSIFLGRGGTDTLALSGVLMSDVANINGVDLANFSRTNTNQAIFGGTAFDYLTLRNGREIYFQGIESLTFADGRLNLMVQTNDTHFAYQWNLHVSDVPSAWRFTQGTKDVLLVSLDSGVVTTLTNRNNIVDTAPTRLLLDTTDDDDSNDNGHGQQAVSVMASEANNGQGIAGINWNSPVEIHDLYNASDRVTLQQAVANTLTYARQNDLRVVFQGGIQGEFWLTDGGTQAQLERLIQNNADIAVFAIAAGNGNIDIDNTDPFNPSVRGGLSGGVARLQTTQSNVIAVGALENRNADGSAWANTWNQGLMNAGQVRRANYSNYGQSLTLMAATDSPAVDRYGNVNYFDGTSAANPNMAGIASLVWSVNSSLTGGEIRQILTDTAMDLGTAGRDQAFGHGLVNADAAVRRAVALNRNQDLANLYTGSSILT